MPDTHTGPTRRSRSGHLVEVVDGVHAWIQPDGTWWLNNAGAVTGGDGTLIIDTCATEARTRRFLAAVAGATGGAPVRFAVNTHEHGDHTYGNSLLPAEVALIGHEVMRSNLLADPPHRRLPAGLAPGPRLGRVTRRVPTIVTRTDLTVHTGTRRIDLIHPGVRRPHRRATSWPGCPRSGSCSPATSSSRADPAGLRRVGRGRVARRSSGSPGSAPMSWCPATDRWPPAGDLARGAGRPRALLPLRPRSGRRRPAAGLAPLDIGPVGRPRGVRRLARRRTPGPQPPPGLCRCRGPPDGPVGRLRRRHGLERRPAHHPRLLPG